MEGAKQTKKKKAIKLVTGRQEVMLFLLPVNPLLNPTDMHLNACRLQPQTYTPQWSHTHKSLAHLLTLYMNCFSSFCFVRIVVFASSHISLSCPPPPLFSTQSGENHRQQSGNQGKRRSSFSSSDSDRTKPFVSLKRTGSSEFRCFAIFLFFQLWWAYPLVLYP